MIKSRFTTAEYMYYLGYALYMVAASFLVNIWSPLSIATKLAGIFLMLVGCVYGIRKIYKTDVLRNVLVLGAIALVALLLDKKLAMLFVFVYAFSNCRFDSLVRIDFAVRLTGFIATCIFCSLGLAEDYVLQTYRVNGELVLRHSLGYAHPNTCFLMIFVILVDYLLLRSIKTGRIRLLDVAVVVCIALIFSSITNCRAGTALIIFLAVVLYCQMKFHLLQHMRWLRTVLSYSTLLCMLLSFFFVFLYYKVPTLGQILNNILTKRISSMAYFLERYGLNLFPTLTERVSTQIAAETGVRALVLDNLYANLVISYGLIFTGVYLYLQTKTCKLFVKNQRYEYLLIFTVFAVYGIVEGMALNLDFNYFLVLTRFALFPNMDQQLMLPKATDRWRWG